MQVIQSRSCVTRIGLALLVSASAQSASAEPGTVGEQSSATIRISVSVAPRFHDLARNAMTSGSAGQPVDAQQSNMVRVRLVRASPLLNGPGAGDANGRAQLLIVVPD
jgi:hypothetical protein